ncbi:MAG: hypothetical protein ACK5PG_09065 [Lysobacterales bacterium]|jgi:hypothetical protein
MHRYLSLTLLLAWLLAALTGVRLVGFVHLLPVLAAIIELMHLLIGGGPQPRSGHQGGGAPPHRPALPALADSDLPAGTSVPPSFGDPPCQD